MQHLKCSIPGILFLICAVGRAEDLDRSEADGVERLELEADELSLSPELDRLVAHGNLRLTAGALELSGHSLVLDLRSQRLQVQSPILTGLSNAAIHAKKLTFATGTNHLFFESPRFYLSRNPGTRLVLEAQDATCHNSKCQLTSPIGTICAHPSSGTKVAAQKLTIHPNGDMDLSRPRVLVDNKPVLALPWIRLRHPHSAGFLPPRIGYTESAGFILGPAGSIPIGKKGAMEGHVAARTASGVEASARVNTQNTTLEIDHLLDSGHNYGRIQSHGHYPLNGAALIADADLVSHRRVIDETTFDPLQRTQTHTLSKARLFHATDNVLVESYFELLEPLNSEDTLGPNRFIPTAAIELAIPAIPFLAMWPEFKATMVRRGSTDPAAMLDVSGDIAPGHSKMELQYGIGLPRRIGPVAIDANIAFRHIAWLIDRAESGVTTHQAALGVDMRIPLVKQFTSLRHRVAPYVRYRLTPWRIGTQPTFVIDESERIRTGHGVEAGFETDLRTPMRRPIAQLQVFQRFDLPGFHWPGGPAYLAASASFGTQSLRFGIDGALDRRENRLSLGGISVSTHPSARTHMTLGARFLSPLLGPHLDDPYTTAGGSFILDRTLPSRDWHTEILEDARIALTQRLGVLLRTRIGVWPTTKIHVIQYGLEFGSECGCVGLSLFASHRPEASIPDVMAGIVIQNI